MLDVEFVAPVHKRAICSEKIKTFSEQLASSTSGADGASESAYRDESEQMEHQNGPMEHQNEPM